MASLALWYEGESNRENLALSERDRSLSACKNHVKTTLRREPEKEKKRVIYPFWTIIYFS